MKKFTALTSIFVLAFVLMTTGCSKTNNNGDKGNIVFSLSGGSSFTYPSKSGMLGSTVANSLQFDGADIANANNKLVIKCPNASGTYSYNANGYPTLVELVKDGKIYISYNSTTVGAGSVNINITGSKATASFTATLYNTLDETDIINITSGSYTGSYASL